MHIKAHAGKGLTNADIEEIVTNISPNPQSWRYISFSSAERSPKCNSTQEKSPSEQCVHTGKWKQHQDTLEKKLFLCVHHLESFQLKLEPQSTQVGAKIMVSPHGGDDMLAQVWSWSEYLSTYFTYEIYFVNHLYLLNGELHKVPKFILFAYETFASMHCNGAALSAEQRWISGSLIWMIMRAPGPSGFVVLILNSQPDLLLPFRGRSFLCPPILSDLANVDLVDDQPSN